MKSFGRACTVLVVIALGNKAYSEYIDLTYALNKDVVLWPGREISFNTEAEGVLPDGTWIASRGFCISEHTSTHMDAPYHFNEKGWRLDRIPFESLIDIPGVCIDIYDKVHRYEDGELKVVENYVLTRDDIIKWEAKFGKIPANAVVLLRSGWGSRWPNKDEFQGIPKSMRTTTTTTESSMKAPLNSTVDLSGSTPLNFPGFDFTAAQFLTTERNVLGVGIDTLSVDPGNSKKFPAHKIFTKKQVYLLENVANLHLLPPQNFRLFVVPFKIEAGTGAPTRVIAYINHTTD